MLALTKRIVRGHLAHVLLAVSWSFILFVWMQRPLIHPQFVDCIRAADENYFIPEVLRVFPILDSCYWDGSFSINARYNRRYKTFTKGLFSFMRSYGQN